MIISCNLGAWLWHSDTFASSLTITFLFALFFSVPAIPTWMYGFIFCTGPKATLQDQTMRDARLVPNLMCRCPRLRLSLFYQYPKPHPKERRREHLRTELKRSDLSDLGKWCPSETVLVRHHASSALCCKSFKRQVTGSSHRSSHSRSLGQRGMDTQGHYRK